MNKINKNNSFGFTFLEMIIAIAILALLIAVALPKFSAFKNSQVVSNSAEEIISAVSKARSQTLSSVASSEYGVHFDTNQIVIYKGTSYSSSDASNEIVKIVSPATISNISLTGGVSEFYFDRLSGAPSKTGTVTVSVSGASSKTITISASGAASSN